MKRLLLILFIIPIIGFSQTETKIEYWDNDNVLSQVHYLDGIRDGSCRYYYKNGTLMNEGFYKNGKMIGMWMSYFEDGQINSHGSYKYTESGSYSRKDGTWKYYNENGQLTRESIIKDGVEEMKFYDKDGKEISMSMEDGC